MNNSDYTVLICDDEKDILNALEIYLSSEGYKVITAGNGQEAIDAVSQNTVHLILMDIMMPVRDGISALMKIRKNYTMPVIFTTAKSEDTDIILGLNIGADDYVTKPFNPVELLARVRSQLRRYTYFGSVKKDDGDIVSVGGIEINDNAKTVMLNGELISLTPKEYDILLLLAKNAGKVYSPAEIYKEVWKEPAIGQESCIAVHIRHIREKTETTPQEPRMLLSVWGQGYKFNK